VHMTFEEIWIASGSNCWSFFYPLTIIAGIAVLIVLSFIRTTPARVILKIAAVFGFSCLATVASSLEISEKWRIRGEWVEAHWESLTDAQRDIAQADGANLVMGPFIYGSFVFFGLIVVAVVLAVIFRNTRLSRRRRE